MQSHYHSVYDGWKADPEGFWKKAAEAIDWFREPEQIFSAGDGVYGRWFKGGETNTCFNCLDRHVAAGRGGESAIIFDSAMNGAKRRFTYGEVLDEVKAIAAALSALGIGKGDRVILYMPMVPEAIFSMLAASCEMPLRNSAVVFSMSIGAETLRSSHSVARSISCWTSKNSLI